MESLHAPAFSHFKRRPFRARAPGANLSLSMRRRLRKKNRLGEFTEFGFCVRAELTPGVDDPGVEAFFDRWIDAVEAQGLAFGGGGGAIFEGFVVRMGRGSATEADRLALSTFLARDSVVVRHDVGALIDAWNAPDHDYTL